jgi:hypothetical protein
MTACGIWPTRRRLIAAVVDDWGRDEPGSLYATDDDERWALIERVGAMHGLDCELILPDSLLSADRLPRFALARGHPVWVAPWSLIDAIRVAAHLRASSRVAAMIARLSTTSVLCGYLRRLQRVHRDPRQLSLL